MTNKATPKPKANPPVTEFRDGLMKIATFRKEHKQEGETDRFSGNLTLSVRDADGNWHDTEYLSSSQYLRAVNLLVQAYNVERELRQAERAAPAADYD